MFKKLVASLIAGFFLFATVPSVLAADKKAPVKKEQSKKVKKTVKK